MLWDKWEVTELLPLLLELNFEEVDVEEGVDFSALTGVPYRLPDFGVLSARFRAMGGRHCSTAAMRIPRKERTKCHCLLTSTN